MADLINGVSTLGMFTVELVVMEGVMTGFLDESAVLIQVVAGGERNVKF